jgi:hypothetical protein
MHINIILLINGMSHSLPIHRHLCVVEGVHMHQHSSCKVPIQRTLSPSHIHNHIYNFNSLFCQQMTTMTLRRD